ncbi:ABC transporter permease [Candidatus Viridilinea mediisalina]|uniref:Transport permease protein n=1 Tax=Candidatus Viridilinea mediisalina TaxID=2024553 RepID=A0A2A6RLX3_9CHLR|nr:ABC transporter permease [Candidatus Viridilinea mediisalina]PDW04057.1 ABC transporter [Candidatus Viridilinea mediisalina]
MTSTTEQGSPLFQRILAQFNIHLFGLRLYHWLWLLFCISGALLVATPRILAQPVIYYAAAETRFELERYGAIYEPVAPNLTALAIALHDANEALRQAALARGEVRFGGPDYRVDFLVAETPGSVVVRGVGATPTEAQQLANAAAEELVRQVRAAGGREILRNMLGWELWQAMQAEGMAAPDPFAVLLREILRTQAFPMSRQPEPFAEARRLADLPAEELNDLARALEARYDLWRFAINTRNATLDALCGTAALSTTAPREEALAGCAAQQPQAAAELAERDREIVRLRTLESALRYLISNYNVAFAPDQPSAAQRLSASLPSAPEPRYVPQLIALATAFGLAFGIGGIALDRSAGITGKMGEIWAYRELIRNLILRDLRTRYKGSALGYLWTQLAPLGMMLVYVTVFSLLLPSGLAMFPVFIIVALLPWNFTAEAIIGGTRSIIDNAALIKKVYFPREVLPLVTVGSSLVNFILSLPMMFLVIAFVQLTTIGRLNLSWTVAYIPVIMIIQMVMLSGFALLLGAGAVFFRDMVHLIGIIINMWFFLTPVIYPLSVLGDGIMLRLIRWLNPMASIIEFYREIIYGNPVPVGMIPTPALPALGSVLRVSVTAGIILVVGYWVFQRVARRFGEEI